MVYQFKCAGCSACYIGETTRHLSSRIVEHLKTDKNSHIYKHLRNNKIALINLMVIVFRDTICLYIASFLNQGLFLEMWGGWMLSSDVAGVLQEAGDAYSRART